MKRFGNFFQHHLSRSLIILLFPAFYIINVSHHSWVKPENVIAWDVKSYYAYLPAAFIHHDLSLAFTAKNPSEYNKWFWPVVTPTGKKCIVTSMGLSFLYAPFFLVGHGVAVFTPFADDGYSQPYAMALVFSAMFYVILGLWFLRKLLLRYFDELTTLITLILVLFGTNLLYYSSWSAAMPHSYNFGLIAMFLYLNNRWHEQITAKNTIVLGLLTGLIVLIRPTNILVLILIAFWKVTSLKSLQDKLFFFLKNYRFILLMAASFVLIWVPQFIYWKYVSGKFLFFSYSGIGGKFFWSHPQIGEILLSLRKGWWIYTPLMLVATLSIVFLFRKLPAMATAIFLFVGLNIYVQASWWCWWFGGGFGLRAFIDSYAILAIPLAVLVSKAVALKWRGAPVLLLLGLLTWYNLFQTKQYNRMAIHWWWMSKTAYSKTFLKDYTPVEYWPTIPIPDYAKARKGVYVSENLITRFEGYQGIKVEPKEIMLAIKLDIKPTARHQRMAERHAISLDSALTIAAYNQYEKSWSVDKWVRFIVTEKLTDSLKSDLLWLDKNVPQWKELSVEYLFDQVNSQVKEEIKNIKF